MIVKVLPNFYSDTPLMDLAVLYCPVIEMDHRHFFWEGETQFLVSWAWLCFMASIFCPCPPTLWISSDF